MASINRRRVPYTWIWIRLLSLTPLIVILAAVASLLKSSSSVDQIESPIDIPLPTNQTVSWEQTADCIVYVPGCSGRLGNGMFVVASAYGLARLHSCRLFVDPKLVDKLREVFVLDLSPLLISASAFQSATTNSLTPMTRTKKSVTCDYMVELTRPNAIPRGSIFETQGYWLSYLHFARYADELREKIFVAGPSTLEKASKFFLKLYQRKLQLASDLSPDNHMSLKRQLARSTRATWIGIHVRRTDFVSMNISSSRSYFVSAMQYYISRYPNAFFIVTSDDKTYCKSLFRKQSNVVVTPTSLSVGDDFIVLSLCQHSIITGGTFSWWAGYLTNGEVLHDNIYASDCENRAYYYPPWYLINGHVRAHTNTGYVL